MDEHLYHGEDNCIWIIKTTFPKARCKIVFESKLYHPINLGANASVKKTKNIYMMIRWLSLISILFITGPHSGKKTSHTGNLSLIFAYNHHDKYAKQVTCMKIFIYKETAPGPLSCGENQKFLYQTVREIWYKLIVTVSKIAYVENKLLHMQ